MKELALLFISGALLASCGKSDDGDDTPTSKPPSASTVGEIGDTTLQGITAFVQKGDYKTWAAEAAVHDSTGPHGKVRSFFNATLATSIKANNTTHPKGSISVKELYASDGATIKGYAVEAKTTDGTGGDTWLWYEGFSPNFNEYYGQGLSTCTGCHGGGGGTDFVRSGPVT